MSKPKGVNQSLLYSSFYCYLTTIIAGGRFLTTCEATRKQEDTVTATGSSHFNCASSSEKQDLSSSADLSPDSKRFKPQRWEWIPFGRPMLDYPSRAPTKMGLCVGLSSLRKSYGMTLGAPVCRDCLKGLFGRAILHSSSLAFGRLVFGSLPAELRKVGILVWLNIIRRSRAPTKIGASGTIKALHLCKVLPEQLPVYTSIRQC